MDQAIQLWTWWLSLLTPLAVVFTRPGWVRFVHWVTGMVLGWEEHTITQLLTALGLESRWRVLEHVAEDGAWDREAVERPTLRLLEPEQPARWGPSHPVAIDDPTRHRTSAKVWGPGTFHEARAQSESGRNSAGPQLGGDGRLGARYTVDLSAASRAPVVSPEPAANRRDLSHQDRLGGRVVAPS
jgi:hypothetical protein